MQNEDPKIGAQYQTMIVLWAALLVSQFLFLVVVFFAKPELMKFNFTEPLSGGENSIPVIALAALGVVTFLESFIMEKKLLRQAFDNQNTGLVQTALIYGCALCEATSLCGLVAAFAFNYQYFFLWIALGIFGILLHFPRRSNLLAASFKA